VDLNLDTLKREILEYLESSGFAVFRSSPGTLEGLPMILWDAEQFPDYQAFLDVARKTGVNIIVFATREFDASDLDELQAQLEECGFTREEQREYESRLRDMRIFEGVTCTLEMAFDYNSRLYVFEVQPDWYDEYLSIEDEIASRMADEEDAGDSSFGGYFSKN
jgi:hypothetical protein